MPLKLTKRKGSDYWYLRGTVCGRSVFESTRVTERSVAEAFRIQREKELLDESVFGRKSSASFLEEAIAYMEQGGERRFLSAMIDHFGTTPIAAIDQAAADRAAMELYPKAKPETRVRQFYTPLKAILHHAAARGHCAPPTIKNPSISKKGRTRWLTPEEADRLIDACASHLRPLIIFMCYTGARASEALYIDWRQVDIDRGEAQFLHTKNGDARGVPLHPRVVEALRALPHRDGMVFRRPDGNPYARKKDGGGQFKTGFKTACRKAGLSGHTPHSLRHSFATWYYMATRDPIGLMELGGWKTDSMVRRYTHVNVSHLSESISALPWRADPKAPVKKAPSRGRVR